MSLSSVPSCDLPRRDEVDRERERQVFAFIEALFLKLELAEVYSRYGVLGLRVKVAVLGQLMQKHCPELHNHMTNEGITPEVFGISWIQTLFLYVEAMPAATIDRIWDIFIFESKWDIIYSVALAILKLSENMLFNKCIDEIVGYFNNFPDSTVLDEVYLLRESQLIDISTNELRDMEIELRKTMR